MKKRQDDIVNIRRLFRRLGRAKGHPDQMSGQRLPVSMQPLVQGLANTQVEEMSCDEVYALLDVFADRERRGEEPAALMPQIQQHLDMCADCREELAALLRSIEATTG